MTEFIQRIGFCRHTTSASESLVIRWSRVGVIVICLMMIVGVSVARQGGPESIHSGANIFNCQAAAAEGSLDLKADEHRYIRKTLASSQECLQMWMSDLRSDNPSTFRRAISLLSESLDAEAARALLAYATEPSHDEVLRSVALTNLEVMSRRDLFEESNWDSLDESVRVLRSRIMDPQFDPYQRRLMNAKERIHIIGSDLQQYYSERESNELALPDVATPLLWLQPYLAIRPDPVAAESLVYLADVLIGINASTPEHDDYIASLLFSVLYDLQLHFGPNPGLQTIWERHDNELLRRIGNQTVLRWQAEKAAGSTLVAMQMQSLREAGYATLRDGEDTFETTESLVQAIVTGDPASAVTAGWVLNELGALDVPSVLPRRELSYDPQSATSNEKFLFSMWRAAAASEVMNEIVKRRARVRWDSQVSKWILDVADLKDP